MKKNGKQISGQFLDGWIRICERRNHAYFSRQIGKELSSLNPGLKKERAIREHYLEKIRIGAAVLGIGGIIVLLCVCNVVMNGDLKEEKYLEKKEQGGGIKSVVLDAEIGNRIVRDVLIEVDEKTLSDSEARKRLEKTAQELEKKILGENTSLQYVDKSLNLINTGEDTNISVFWTSSNYGVLQEDGTLGADEIPQEGVEVILTAFLSYNNIQIKKQIPVKVFPRQKTENEKVKEELLTLVEQQKASTKSSDFLELPESLNDTKIVWREKKADRVITIFGFTIIVFLALLWGKDKEVHRKYEERNQQLLLEYSEFVSKLQLLVCSGMSMRNVFIRLGKDYQKRKEKGGCKKYVYEELLVVIRKMENGMSEMEAYDYFGKRCDLICYKKLVAMIQQNVRKGTDGLRISLLAEIKNAFQERKQAARKMGEEAGTKLLLPMMMMMGIVLIIIIIPAYFSFGGI